MPQLEHIPPEESGQIDKIIQLTLNRMRARYPGEQTVLRGVHPKDHGCVAATFRVDDDLPEDLRVGVFKTPGREYEAWIRFSNAAPLLKIADSPLQDPAKGPDDRAHGSRGMALKLLGVEGESLLSPQFGPLTQDFLMVNHPVFPFANVEDYEVLSNALVDHNDNPKPFFKRLKVGADKSPDMTDPASKRAWRTKEIIEKIQSLGGKPEPYQPPPQSPVDNRYFSAAPFSFGPDWVMKYSAKPESPVAGDPANLADADYLRNALLERLTAPGAQSIHFQFQVQLRSVEEISTKIDDIENACTEWAEDKTPFRNVGRITIPPQNFDTEEQRGLAGSLIFTPWHGLVEHRPLGGINRLRRAVYEASAAMRHVPKEPAHAKLSARSSG